MTEPMTFDLVRTADPSGVSGTGIPATGVAFPDGHVALRWDTPDLPSSTQLYESVEDMLKVHGHNGATVVRWHDEIAAERRTPLQRMADYIAGGADYHSFKTPLERAIDDEVSRVRVHVQLDAWDGWMDAMSGSSDASVFVDRDSEYFTRERRWTSPDGVVTVFTLIHKDETS